MIKNFEVDPTVLAAVKRFLSFFYLLNLFFLIFYLFYLLTRPDYISPLDDLAFAMYQDPEISQIIRDLDKKKSDCVIGIFVLIYC